MKKTIDTQVNRLRTVFTESGLSNVEIAGKLSCSPAYVSKINLQDDVRPRTTFLLSVAHAFNISEKWLIEGDGPMRISLDDKLKAYLESLATSMNSNDIFIRNSLEKYLSLSNEEQTAFIQTLSHLFGSK